MRYVLIALSLMYLLESGLLAELMEFPAASSNSLQIPAGTSIQINGASGKGDASQYIKFSITTGETSYDLGDYMYPSGLYINGPASLNVSPVTVTPRNNIPYKLDKYGGIWKDLSGTGQFTQWIDSMPWGLSQDGATIVYNPLYQAYLDWKNAGNVPLPADAYTGDNIAGSGVLIDFTRYSNQPFKSIIIPTGTTKNITVPAGKRIICRGGLAMMITYARPILRGSGGSAESGAINSEPQPVGLIVKTRGYNIPSQEIEGPEELIISYNQSTTSLGGGGSATSTTGSQTGPSFGIFTYYFADESSTPVSDSAANDIANKIVSTIGNYGLVTKNELNAALTQSRTDGINSVISNPNLWTLYTASQIQNMAMGDLVLNKNVNGTFTLNYDIEQSTDLQNWTPYQALALPLNGLPTDKAFVRVKLKK